MTNSHATWLREHAAWLDASMGYVAIPAARMRDAADELERLRAALHKIEHVAINFGVLTSIPKIATIAGEALGDAAEPDAVQLRTERDDLSEKFHNEFAVGVARGKEIDRLRVLLTQAMAFLEMVRDGRGTEDEWPALDEFLSRAAQKSGERP